MSNVALPAPSTATTGPVGQGSMLPAASGGGGAPSGTLVISRQQRAFLDALNAGGLHPSSELLALSIGSYVCQARAAGQSPQAVWDFVHPLVSTDVHNAHVGPVAPSVADVDAATQSYIRTATSRLC
jgi:hypothetical protein